MDSLKTQTDQDFQVNFVDYGSKQPYADDARELITHYNFVSYVWYPVTDQPWNKSRALNTIIRSKDDEFVFVADVDMIFHTEFIARARKLMRDDRAVYFKVGFLSEEESDKNLPFGEYQVKFYSDAGATGLTLFPVKLLRKLRGFDEFYHFWGSEDTDMHVRLRNAGHEVEFYDEETLLLHQWHVIYRNKESSELTEDLQLSGIVQINYEYLKNAISEKRTVVNKKAWGEIPSESVIASLEELECKTVLNGVYEIDSFLFGTLPSLAAGRYAFRFIEDKNREIAKESLKRFLGKNTKPYYNLKQVNDRILLHLISFYRDLPYTYKIIDGGTAIDLRIAIS